MPKVFRKLVEQANRPLICALLFACALFASSALAQTPRPTERNVIYGMVSGTALLLDVYRPAKPNGFGVVFVAGSAFQASPAYDARPIKETQVDLWGPPLLAAGYTVFAVNHRGAPQFHFPAAIDDVTRAIRYVHAHAGDYGIDAQKLGGLGGSSGGNLIALAGFRAAPGNTGSADAVERQPATLAAIVLRAAVSDLRTPHSPRNMGFVVSYMETPPGDSPAAKALYDAASPVTQVTAQAPPTLLIHGDADDLVPFAQSVALEDALRKAGIATRLVTIPGGQHAPDFGGQPRADWPDYFGETVAWFDRHLRGRETVVPARPGR
jgi:acetyl esterase/lipase